MIVVNGRVGDSVSAADRGLAYGDGVFRTFPARDGTPRHWTRQYARLEHDCAALGLALAPPETLADEVRTACGGVADAVVKVMITRGAGRRGYDYDAGTTPTRVVFTEARGVRSGDKGVRVRRCTLRLASQPALAGVKHLNRLENVLARAEWTDPDIAEGVLCDTAGNAIGGTMTNVFMVKGGGLATPRLDECGVAGVTRDRVIEAAARHGIACEVRGIPWEELAAADEVFLTNSVIGVWPVRELEGLAKTSALTSRVRDWLDREDSAAR